MICILLSVDTDHILGSIWCQSLVIFRDRNRFLVEFLNHLGLQVASVHLFLVFSYEVCPLLLVLVETCFNKLKFWEYLYSS